MTTYNIKVVSQTNSIILIFSLLTIFIGGVFLFFPKGLSQDLSILVTILSMTLAYFLWQKFVTGRTEWTVDNDGLKMKWIKKFTFSNERDIKLKWADVKKISDRGNPHYHTFKIELTSEETIIFYHDNLTTRDDYKALKQVLEQILSDEKSYSQQKYLQ